MRNATDRVLWSVGQRAEIIALDTLNDPNTGFTDATAYPDRSGGIGMVSGLIRADRSSTINLYGSAIKGDLELHSAQLGGGVLRLGSQMRGGILASGLTQQQYGIGGSDANYAAGEIRNAAAAGVSKGVGVRVVGGNCRIGPMAINDCDSHAVESVGAFVNMTDIVSGSGNTGAGLYAHRGSTVLANSGAMPTVTGTVGDVAISNPAAEEATWGTVASTPQAPANTNTLVDAVAEKLPK
jgi:hypothetical protein